MVTTTRSSEGSNHKGGSTGANFGSALRLSSGVHSHNIDITELRPFDDHPGIAAFGFLKLFHDEPDGCFAAVKFAQLLPRSNFPCGQLKEGAASALDQR